LPKAESYPEHLSAQDIENLQGYDLEAAMKAVYIYTIPKGMRIYCSDTPIRYLPKLEEVQGFKNVGNCYQKLSGKYTYVLSYPAQLLHNYLQAGSEIVDKITPIDKCKICNSVTCLGERRCLISKYIGYHVR
jgi:hypothetical protein